MTFEIRHYRGADDLGLFLSLPYVLNHEVADDLEKGRRREEWMWLATRDERLVGRLSLWSPPGGDTPTQLDIFDTDITLSEDEQRRVAAALLEAARGEVITTLNSPPEFARYLSADWREHPDSRRETEMLIEVMEASGARVVVERLRMEWRAGTPIPPPDARLSFRPFRSEDELLDLTALVLSGTLDAHSVEELAGDDARAVARSQYEGEFQKYSSPREWWRVAVNEDGDEVGFVFPARNSYHPIIAYIGVLPDHRGRGYIHGILSEGTRVLGGAGADHIRASTDVGNVPMANAFACGGYPTFERLINMSWN
ncbi:GNAT family N-acetyltransferase [Microbacterium murale]|uniref:GNAT superfamily N-acetyltransferase n=1 Tax=Microbacterium murale TaxID=1081040 RepID=A0ABU0P750_9MICO|nr:GNAT family N-acetyltransferase [Microbacterium murale]MDQ0643165.1 GNAT superfamily N-acetyltransferase [Microbacterium murale]